MTPTTPCSLPPESLEERARDWHALDGALVDADRTTTGVVLRYRLEPEVAPALLALIEAEGRCCPTLSFRPHVTVHIDAPEAMRPWLASTFTADPRGPRPEPERT